MGATVDASAAADRLLTEEVALVDRSERGKLALTGAQAKELLSCQVTNDMFSQLSRRCHGPRPPRQPAPRFGSHRYAFAHAPPISIARSLSLNRLALRNGSTPCS